MENSIFSPLLTAFSKTLGCSILLPAKVAGKQSHRAEQKPQLGLLSLTWEWYKFPFVMSQRNCVLAHCKKWSNQKKWWMKFSNFWGLHWPRPKTQYCYKTLVNCILHKMGPLVEIWESQWLLHHMLKFSLWYWFSYHYITIIDLRSFVLSVGSGLHLHNNHT